MKKRNKINKLVGLVILTIATVSTVYASATNFTCPQPSEITSTDFTAPSIWVAPPVAHSISGMVGVGLGGKEVKEFIGAQEAVVNHKQGWICIYHAKGGFSILELQAKIKQVTETNQFLKKYSARVNQLSDKAQPFLKNYPQDTVIGFVGYQKA